MPQDLEKFTQVKLLDGIISAMKKKKLSEASITAAFPYIQTFARRINVSDDAAMLFSAFFDDLSDVSKILLIFMIAIKLRFLRIGQRLKN